MKKIIALLSVIICTFAMTACGGEVNYTEFEQQKIDMAEQIATQDIIPFLKLFMTEENVGAYDENTAEEISAIMAQNYSLAVDGNAVKKGITSFYSVLKEMGEIGDVVSAEGKIDGDKIVVMAQVNGIEKDAEAELIFSNDMFLELESASLSPISTMSELMSRAGLNTVIGMGTVFAVLIIIIAVISALGVVPKMMAGNVEAADDGKKVAAPAAAPAAGTAPAAAPAQLSDAELVAVIAAAIAAYEGASSTDGYVVRSIRKVNKSRR